MAVIKEVVYLHHNILVPCAIIVTSNTNAPHDGR
jgi:hypothetical protein